VTFRRKRALEGAGLRGGRKKTEKKRCVSKVDESVSEVVALQWRKKPL